MTNLELITRDLVKKSRQQCIDELREHAVSMAKALRRFSFPDISPERKLAVGSRTGTEARLIGFCTAIEILTRYCDPSEQTSYYAEMNTAVAQAALLLPYPKNGDEAEAAGRRDYKKASRG